MDGGQNPEVSLVLQAWRLQLLPICRIRSRSCRSVPLGNFDLPDPPVIQPLSER
jgi:hypothetical protein